MPLARVDKVAKAIPSDLGMTLDKALSVSPDLARMVEGDEEIKRTLHLSEVSRRHDQTRFNACCRNRHLSGTPDQSPPPPSGRQRAL